MSDGKKDWKHLTDDLKHHETAPYHVHAYHALNEAEIRLKTMKTIDSENQRIINKETTHWKNVLKRMFAITQYLSQHNLAFRGSNEKLYEKGNGNFLGLVQLLGKFDPVMQEHIHRIMTNKAAGHYLGKHIQNEMITLMAVKVKEEIIRRAKYSKYFSVILDCTPDLSHQEVLSVIIRFVELEHTTVSIKEHFLGFINVLDVSGAGLTETMLTELEKCGLEISNCRGQGYDNGSNMKGKHVGVQRRVLDLNPCAFFVPCACHSLNLILGDAAKSSVKVITFFGILQRFYVLFSASVQRWNILKQHVDTYTFKPLCETRWECRIDSVKALRYQVAGVKDALLALANERHADPAVRHEATTLAQQIDFQFLLSLVIWYDLLFRANLVSKVMQAKSIDIGEAMKLLESFREFMVKFREEGFIQAKVTARELAEEADVDPEFNLTFSRRQHNRRRLFDYEGNDEPIINAEDQFRVEFFIKVVDIVSASINERFEQLQEHSMNWDFLYNVQQLPENQILLKKCKNLQALLTQSKLESISSDEENTSQTINKNVSDISGEELYDELRSLKDLTSCNKQEVAKPIEVLKFIQEHSLMDVCPNIWVAIRILLTIPVSVASAERSFSKLKLIKTYLRTTMTESRLSGLAMLSIENEIVEGVD